MDFEMLLLGYAKWCTFLVWTRGAAEGIAVVSEAGHRGCMPIAMGHMAGRLLLNLIFYFFPLCIYK